jgi:heat shock protein HslJ
VRWTATKTGVWLVGILAAAMLLAGCGSDASADTLTNTEWELEELHGRDVLDDISVTMKLGEDDELSGSGGCNRYIGTWETDDGDKITLAASGTTMMACDQPVMDQEQAFLEALASTVRFDLEDEELELYNAEGREVADFNKLKPASLTRTDWEVTAINNGQQGVVPVLDNTTLTALFETEDDMLSGQSGCNTYTTTFSRDGDEITIETPAITLMACDQPVMDQEAQFLQALEQAHTFELGHETLYLRAEDGSLLVMFREND